MEWDNDCESEWSDVYEGVNIMSNSLSMAIMESFSGWFNSLFQMIFILSSFIKNNNSDLIIFVDKIFSYKWKIYDISKKTLFILI